MLLNAEKWFILLDKGLYFVNPTRLSIFKLIFGEIFDIFGEIFDIFGEIFDMPCIRKLNKQIYEFSKKKLNM